MSRKNPARGREVEVTTHHRPFEGRRIPEPHRPLGGAGGEPTADQKALGLVIQSEMSTEDFEIASKESPFRDLTK